jgi:2-phosphosulfolactate phosphatase
VASIQDEPRIDVLCAGTNGIETAEDILAAGGFVTKICSRDGPPAENVSDTAAMAEAKWNSMTVKAEAAGRSVNEQLAIELRDTPGGRNLLGIGLDQDLVDCAQIDALDVVPELDAKTWRIRLA